MPEELLKSKIKQSKLIKAHQNNLEISKKIYQISLKNSKKMF